LGSSTSFDAVERRSELIKLAAAAGVLAPEMMPVTSTEEVHAALTYFGLPAVLKVDASWGGLAAAVVNSFEEGEQCLRRFLHPPSGARALKHMVVDRDPFDLLPGRLLGG
jgi:carbamoylphosphate synthase large subunit